MAHQLKISNSFFTTKPKQKWTWKSPAGHENEIEFIFSNNIKSISKIVVVNNLNFITDHRLIRATLTISKKYFRKQQFNTMPKGKWAIINEQHLKQNVEGNMTLIVHDLVNMNVHSKYTMIENLVN